MAAENSGAAAAMAVIAEDAAVGGCAATGCDALAIARETPCHALVLPNFSSDCASSRCDLA